MKFLRVDYAFESHPVLSPVHRVSVSISPYLFSHPEKSAQAREPLMTEVPQEKEIMEESAPEEPETSPSQNEPKNVEHQEEISDRPPAGGVYWEE